MGTQSNGRRNGVLQQGEGFLRLVPPILAPRPAPKHALLPFQPFGFPRPAQAAHLQRLQIAHMAGPRKIFSETYGSVAQVATYYAARSAQPECRLSLAKTWGMGGWLMAWAVSAHERLKYALLLESQHRTPWRSRSEAPFQHLGCLVCTL